MHAYSNSPTSFKEAAMSKEALKYYGQISRRRAAFPLTPNEHRVLSHLATRHSALKTLNPAMSDIGNQTGIKTPNVHRATKGLESKGLIVVTRTKGQRTSSIYHFPRGFDKEGSGEQWLAGIKAIRGINAASKGAPKTEAHSYQSDNHETAQTEPETEPPNGFHSYQSDNPHSYQTDNAFKQDKRPAPIYAAKRGKNRSQKMME
jgi:hypothetical protein